MNANIKNKLLTRDLRRDHIALTLGTSCFFCSEADCNLATHRKDGRRHKKFSDMGIAWLRQEVTVGNYVRLCYPCHKGVHWAMEYLGMNWEQIVDTWRRSSVG